MNIGQLFRIPSRTSSRTRPPSPASAGLSLLRSRPCNRSGKPVRSLPLCCPATLCSGFPRKAFRISPFPRNGRPRRSVFPDDGIFTVAVLSADTESSRQVGRTGEDRDTRALPRIVERQPGNAAHCIRQPVAQLYHVRVGTLRNRH